MVHVMFISVYMFFCGICGKRVYLLYMWGNNLFDICVLQCCYTMFCLFKCMLP
jgi:hypothetical protein